RIHRFRSLFFSSRRRHTRSKRDWSSDVCSSDLSDSPVNANEHESGPESPIAYGMSVPRGATQVGPLVRMRSQKLIDAYQPELDEIGRASCREREKRGEHAV